MKPPYAEELRSDTNEKPVTTEEPNYAQELKLLRLFSSVPKYANKYFAKFTGK